MLIVRLTRTCNLLCTFQLDASEARLAAKELAPLYRLTLFTVWAFPASLNMQTIERRTAPSASRLRSVQIPTASTVSVSSTSVVGGIGGTKGAGVLVTVVSVAWHLGRRPPEITNADECITSRGVGL